MVDQPKKNKKSKFEINPEVSDRDTKAGEIKMESRVISGGYRDDDGKYHPPKTADSVLRNKLKKKAEIMKKHMDTLKEPYKTVIEMREIKKMAYKDIADHLGKNLSTIKSQIRNGRHILISQSKKELFSSKSIMLIIFLHISSLSLWYFSLNLIRIYT